MKKAAFLATVLIVLLLMAAACAVNPVTGKRELSLISEEGEISLGKETDAQIAQEYGFYGDPDLAKYVTSVGMAMVPYTHRPSLVYHFAVLDSPVVNAFAAPGGYVYVTRGILALMNSESELAVVLGHELGHVNARHSVKKLSQMLLVQVGLAVGSAISDTFAKISGVAGIGVQLLFLKFSRDDEREADALGVDYARKGRFNSGEMVNFFTALEKYGDLAGGGHSLPGFLSTHPLTGERIKNVQSMITPSDTGLPKKREPYMLKIEDVVYGSDPRQGYVESNTFYHPGMRFAFDVPGGWKIQNTPTQVTIAPKNGNAAVILQAETSAESLAAFAQKKAAGITGRQFLSDQNLTVNGMAAYHQLYNIVQQDKDTLKLRLTCLRKGGTVFYFSALSKALDFGSYDSTFRTIVSSFIELKDPHRLNRQPHRIKILKADGRKSLKVIFTDNGMNKELWPTLAVANGMDVNGIPEKNQLIKIVR
jgi:predicted Zn-dependent protease